MKRDIFRKEKIGEAKRPAFDPRPGVWHTLNSVFIGQTPNFLVKTTESEVAMSISKMAGFIVGT